MAPAEYPSPSRVKTFEGFLHKWLSFLSLSLLLSKIGEPVLQGPHETSPPHCHLPFAVMSQVSLGNVCVASLLLLYSQYYKICFEFYNFVAF